MYNLIRWDVYADWKCLEYCKTYEQCKASMEMDKEKVGADVWKYTYEIVKIS